MNVCLYEGDFIFCDFVPCCIQCEKMNENRCGKECMFHLVLLVFIFMVQGIHMSFNRKGRSRVGVPDDKRKKAV